MQLTKVIIDKTITVVSIVFKKFIVIFSILICTLYCKSQTGPYGLYFNHNSTLANSNYFNCSTITNPATDFDSTVQLQVTHNYSKGNTFCDFSFGVWLDRLDTSKWSIYNETEYQIPLGAGWNVLVPLKQGTSFVHTATDRNITSSESEINNAALNGNPDAIFFVTQNLNPGGSYISQSHSYFNLNSAVYYNYTTTFWTITSEQHTAFIPNTAFNIFVPDQESSNVFIQIADGANTSANSWATYIDNPVINNDTNAVLIITQNLSVSGGVYNNHPVGVWFDRSVNKWSIFNEDKSPIPIGSAFNVLYVNRMLTTGINSDNSPALNSQFNAYPNPSQDKINITYKLKTASNVTITLVDTRGVVVKELKQGIQQAGMQKFTDDVSQLPEGIYIYELKSATELLHKKVIIIH